ncbi:hypothetical protein [Legionella fallonii]|uniref:Uncharacterized protein n=1 Tax=Legionella fallonii LLAP-10 TaxID=1212491 RepID=A0A098G0Q0_9GAMM|nr:hypothetical protein [Legionella fallonii]CEG56038.1 protein of unknown function [Legionella fallonii LLAP-10]
MEQEEQDNYEARKLSGSEGYESAQPHLTNQQTLSLGNYERLSFDSDLFKSSNDGVKELGFESKVYWSFKEHEVEQFQKNIVLDLYNSIIRNLNLEKMKNNKTHSQV